MICSDASLTGWGGVYENNSTGGKWSEDQGSYHINQLELLAVYLTLQSVNKMGGMKENLNELTRKPLIWCKNRNIWMIWWPI